MATNRLGWNLRLACLSLLACSVVMTSPVLAQARNPEQEVQTDWAPVTLDGRVLFKIAGVASTSADQRAAGISERIALAAADASVQPDDVRVLEVEGLHVVQAGDHRLLVVTEHDAKMQGIRESTLAEYCRQQIVAGIKAARAERQAGPLLRNLGVALVALLALVAALWGSNRLVRFLQSKLTIVWQSRLAIVDHQALRIVEPDRVQSAVLSAIGLCRSLLWLVLIVLFVEYAFGLFPWTRVISQRIIAMLFDPLQRMGLGLLNAFPDLVFLLVLAVVVRYVLKLARATFDGIHHETLVFANFEPEWAPPTYRIVRILVLAFAAVVAYPYLPGSGSEAFKGISIFLGLLFSLGSSSALANVIAGYSLTYRRAFRVGDRIRIGDDVGDVTDVRLQVTHLRTPKNEEIIIPNSNILGSNVVNYSKLARQGALILHTEVGIGYETPWRQVEAMLLAAAARTNGLLREPSPFVYKKALRDFNVVYEINAYCDNAQAQLQLYSELHKNILDVFNEYGVQIMTPAYEGDPEVPKVVPKSKWYQPPAERSDEAPTHATEVPVRRGTS